MFSQTNEKLRRDLDDCEQMRAQHELTISQLRASNRDLSGKLKVEKDEVGHHYHCVFFTDDLSTVCIVQLKSTARANDVNFYMIHAHVYETVRAGAFND